MIFSSLKSVNSNIRSIMEKERLSDLLMVIQISVEKK